MSDAGVRAFGTEVLWGIGNAIHTLWLQQGYKRKSWERGMDHVRFGIGTVWMFFTIGAAVLLGAEFISHEIHAFIKHRREPEAK